MGDAAAGQIKFVSTKQLPGSECKTPITPNSKYSLDLLFSTTSTKQGEESSSLCSIDSPSSYSTIVKTISNRHRLAVNFFIIGISLFFFPMRRFSFFFFCFFPDVSVHIAEKAGSVSQLNLLAFLITKF